MDYLSLVNMAGPEESSHAADRSRSIFDLMDERKYFSLMLNFVIGNAEFSNMQNLSELQRESFAAQHRELSKKTMQIVITDKVNVMFHMND